MCLADHSLHLGLMTIIMPGRTVAVNNGHFETLVQCWSRSPFSVISLSPYDQHRVKRCAEWPRRAPITPYNYHYHRLCGQRVIQKRALREEEVDDKPPLAGWLAGRQINYTTPSFLPQRLDLHAFLSPRIILAVLFRIGSGKLLALNSVEIKYAHVCD